MADMHFIVHFEDGETVQGKSLGGLDTGWNSLPDKPISRLVYVNPFGDMIVLQGYEEYNHMVECLQPMGGRPYITDVYLMGARDGLVTVYRLRAFQDTSQDAVRVGDVTVRVYPRGKEYLDSETWGWRRGLKTA